MQLLRARISIRSLPTDVFGVLVNFSAYREWNPWLRDVEGEAKEGALVCVRPNLISLFGFRLRYRLTKIRPKDFLRWEEEAWFGILFHTTREYQIYTCTDESAIYSIHLRFHGPLRHIIRLFYGKSVQRGLFREAQALKQYCEKHYLLQSTAGA